MAVNNKLQFVKGQGQRSNTRDVQTKLRQHILNFANQSEGGLQAMYEDGKRGAMKNVGGKLVEGSPNEIVDTMANSPMFEFETAKVNDFIESLGLRKSKPEYSDEETWNLYKSLLGREIRNLLSNPKLAEKLMKPIVPAAEPKPAQAPAQPQAAPQGQAPLPPLDQIKK
jgi:hypothetical protein